MNCLRTLDNAYERTWPKVGPFLAATYCITKGIENVQTCLSIESSTTLFKVGALQFPVVFVVAGVVTKIFDACGWQPSDFRFMAIWTFSTASTALVMSIALARLGLTTSSDTGLLVSIATAQLILGAGCVDMGIRNVLFNDNQRPPVLRF